MDRGLPSPHRRRRLLRVAAAAIALAALLLAAVGFAAGCGLGAQAQLITCALDPGAIDIKAAGAPATIPALSSGVPKDSIFEITQWIAQSQGLEPHSRRWVDFEKRRARWDWYGDPAGISSLGSTTTGADPSTATILYSSVIDGEAGLSYDAVTARLSAQPAWDVSAIGGSDEDPGWSGRTPVLLGRQLLNGVNVDVYRIDLHISAGQERTADFGLIYVDSASGLRVREEWLLGSPGDAWVYHVFDCRLLPRSAGLEARMKPDALKAEQAEVLAERLAAVKSLDYPVWGLPATTGMPVLSGLTISTSDRGGSVLLYYLADDRTGASIETIDVRSRTDFPANLLVSRQEALANSPNPAQQLDFGMGSDERGDVETGVRILLWPGSAKPADMPSLTDAAEALVDLRSQ